VRAEGDLAAAEQRLQIDQRSTKRCEAGGRVSEVGESGIAPADAEHCATARDGLHRRYSGCGHRRMAGQGLVTPVDSLSRSVAAAHTPILT
jgi:hypothetical protein